MAKELFRPADGEMVEFDFELEGIVSDVVLVDVLESSMETYGTMTIEDRAIADYRDGFIPLYRRLLWSMYRSKMWPSESTRKCAKVVGDVMGAYHPHGDGAIYGGLVTLANYSYSLIHKQGNFGNLTDPPAAMRYTECRLSSFALANALDPYLMNIVEPLPSYDGKDVEPLLFTPNLPFTLLYGTLAGIAVGVTSFIPSFTAESLKRLITLAMKRSLDKKTFVPLTARDCAKVLEFYHHTGGTVISTEDEIAEFFSDSAGQIRWECEYHWDDKRHALMITGFPPNWNVSNMADRFRNMDEVRQVTETNDGNANVDDRKIQLEVVLKKGTASEVEEAWDKVCKLLFYTAHYKCNFTERYVVESDGVKSTRARFFKSSIPALIDRWIKWRVAQHTKALQFERSTLVSKREREVLIMRTLNVLDEMYEMLKRTRREPNFDNVAAFAKLLSISLEDSKLMWAIPIGRFRGMDVNAQQTKIDEIDARLAQIATDLKQRFLATARWLYTHTTL